MYRKGRARRGPTLHEALLMHAVARLVLAPWISNIQASWVKMGPHWAGELLKVGCNDMGGSIMNESITRYARHCHAHAALQLRVSGRAAAKLWHAERQ